MALRNDCPPLGALEELLGGKLVDPQLHDLAEHLEHCSECQERARTLAPHDTLVEALRGDSIVADAIASEIPRPLVEKLKQITQERVVSADTVGMSRASAAGADDDPLNFLSPAEQPDELGRLGYYRILKVLGKGGMGAVFLAEDPKLERQVALKVMLPKIAADPTAKDRFIREARAAAKLRSDHIVTIHQVDEANGVPYLAMELLEGKPLDELIRERSLTVPQILQIGQDVAKGLAVAHEKGLIHRDIKPANLWIDEAHGNRVKILDFGLARAEKDESHITQSGAIVGTPAYMAPEQARGEKGVDGRADLFSLGCVLYRLCVGEIPFKGETTMGTLMALAMNDPVPPSDINETIPRQLSELIMQLLEKEPAKRPASAKALVARLAEIERDLANAKRKVPDSDTVTTVSAVSETDNPRSPVVVRRKLMPFVLMALALFVAVGVGTWAIIRFSTEQGDYVIDTDDPDFAFSVGKEGVFLEDRKIKRRYNLKVVGGSRGTGEHELEVTDVDADLSFKMKNFTIKRGERVALKAWFERRQEVVKGSSPAVPPASDRDRAVLRFDASGRVEIFSKVKLHLDTFTLEGWYLMDSNRHKGGNSADLSLIWVGPNLGVSYGAQDRYYFTHSGGTANLKSDGDANGNEWTHVAVTQKGLESTLFVNGKLALRKQNDATLFEIRTLGDLKLRSTMMEIRISKTVRYDKDFIPAKRFVPDPDTIALYHCDEGQGDVLKDSSGNGHHGKIVGAKWVKADGGAIAPLADLALDFDGKSVVEIPTLSRDDIAPTTIEAYVTINASSGAPIVKMQGRAFCQLYGWPDKQNPTLWVPNALDDGGKFGVGTPSMQPGRRYHLVMQIDGQSAQLFIDGKQVGAEKRSPRPPMNKSRGTFLGADSALSKLKLVATLDEIRISKVFRYQGDFVPAQRFEPDADTLALYHCDEGRGDVLNDSSGNGHHGKIVGAKWVKADGTPIVAPTDQADDATLRRILAEIELAPSLYAMHQESGNLKLPNVAAMKLAAYSLDEPTIAAERDRFRAAKEKYAKDHPLRAAMFDAIGEMETACKLPIRLALPGDMIPKVKAALLLEQQPIGQAIFSLERALEAMLAADAQRGNEKGKRWLANFDFTRCRLEANLIFLYEYNHSLGRIRADNLPELAPAQTGWQLRFQPALQVTEAKVRLYQKDMMSRLKQIQTEHAGSPWAFFAERETQRSLGMQWTPCAKPEDRP